MHISQKRVLTFAGMGALAVPLTAVAIAYACTSIATLSMDRSSALAGSTITVTGKGFTPHDAGDTTTDAAKVRFDDIDGAVVATANPSSAADGGKFSIQVQVPGLGAGDHVLVVTQNGSDGRPAYGTPARQVFTVLEAAAAPAAAPAVAAATPPLSQPMLVPTLTKPSGDAAKLTKAVASCKKKFSIKKAKTRSGKRSMARKRATCVSSAERKYA